MPRKKVDVSSGVIKKQKGDGWYARLRFRKPDGSLGEICKKAPTKTKAREEAQKLESKYKKGGDCLVNAEYMTFRQLGKHFNDNKVKDAIYYGEKKVAGYKHPKALRNRVNRLVEYFGDREISNITHTDCETFKLYLIQTPTKFKRQRSMEETNGQLRILRQVFNYAARNKWLEKNPMSDGESLINPSDERRRNRPEDLGDLAELIKQCTGRSAYFRPWIVCAIETSARPGEISRLRRCDILWDEGVIRLRVRVTKTQRERFVPLTTILAAELQAWFEYISKTKYWKKRISNDPEALIFANFKSRRKAWEKIRENAKLPDIQMKDLRHWGTTRLVSALRKAGIPELQGMEITGHTQIKTYLGYIKTGQQVVRDIGKAIEQHRPDWESEPNNQWIN